MQRHGELSRWSASRRRTSIWHADTCADKKDRKKDTYASTRRVGPPWLDEHGTIERSQEGPLVLQGADHILPYGLEGDQGKGVTSRGLAPLHTAHRRKSEIKDARSHDPLDSG